MQSALNLGATAQLPLPAESVSLRQLRYLIAISRLGSISAAARYLARTQTAITKAIAELEAQLGVNLIERLSRGVRCTPLGDILVRRACAAARALDLQGPAEIGPGKDDRHGQHANHTEHTELRRLSSARHPMNLGNLKLNCFLLVMRWQSIAAAANALAIGPAAVRKNLRLIETQLDEQLFERSANGALLPTPFAISFAMRGRLAFAEVAIALDEIRSANGATQGRVTIGSVPFVRTALLPAALAQCSREHPQIRLATREASYAELELALLSGELDFIVGPLLPGDRDSRIVRRPFLPAPVGIVVRAGHPLLRRARLSPADLQALGWILPPPGAPSRRVFEEVMGRHGIDPTSRAIETSSYAVRRGLLLETDFAAISPLIEFHYELANGSLVRLRPDFISAADEQALSNESYIVLRRHSELSAASTLCLRYLDDAARTFAERV